MHLGFLRKKLFILLVLFLCGIRPAWADIVVFSPEATLPEGFFQAFEDLYGQKVQLVEYQSADEMEKDILAGNRQVDLVLTRAIPYFVRQQEASMYQPIEKSLLPNIGQIAPSFFDEFARIDTDISYGLPYIWGTYGIAWRSDLVAQQEGVVQPLDWEAVFDAVQLRHIANCNVLFPVEAQAIFPLSISYLNEDFKNISPARIKEVEQFLLGLSPYIEKWIDPDLALKELQEGNACVTIVPTMTFAKYRWAELQERDLKVKKVETELQSLEQQYSANKKKAALLTQAAKQARGNTERLLQELFDQQIENAVAVSEIDELIAAAQIEKDKLNISYQAALDKSKEFREEYETKKKALQDELTVFKESPLEFIVPEGKNVLDLYVLAIAKNSTQTLEVHQLIDYFLTPHNASRLTNIRRVPTTLPMGRDLAKLTIQKDREIFPFNGNIEQLSLLPRFNNTVYRQAARAWSNILKVGKTQSGQETPSDGASPVPILKPEQRATP